MIYKVIVTPQAERNLVEITDYIARDNPVRALSFVDELQQRIQSLKTRPMRHAVVSGYRRIVHGNYLIVYHVREDEGAVYVLLVTEGHRNWTRLLGKRPRPN